MDKAKLKQRLIGAAVLLTLVAIIVPVLVDRLNDGDSWSSGGNIPPKPANGFVTRVLPLDKWSEQARSDLATVEIPPAPSRAEKAAQPVTPEPQKDTKSDTSVQAKDVKRIAAEQAKDEKTVAPEQPKAGKPAVSVSAPAKAVTAPPAAQPEPAVSVPPKDKASAAPVSAPDKEVAPAAKTEAGASTRGWVVQLGSFSSQKNAEELRDRLLAKDYRAYVESISSQGRMIYRVRIGPQAQRAEAESLRERLERELRLHPVVITVP